LLSDNREHFKLDSVELIEARPGSARSKTLEKFTHLKVVKAIRAVEHNALSSEGLREILDSLGLSSTGRSLGGTTVVKVESTAESSVASIGKRCDHKTG
jgi:hypothetical protein